MTATCVPCGTCTDLIINISKNSFAWRTDLGIIQCPLHFGQTLCEDIKFQFFHFKVGCLDFFFICILLAELFQFQFSRIKVQLCLTHLIRSTEPKLSK